jgi:hypothetical protein
MKTMETTKTMETMKTTETTETMETMETMKTTETTETTETMEIPFPKLKRRKRGLKQNKLQNSSFFAKPVLPQPSQACSYVALNTLLAWAGQKPIPLEAFWNTLDQMKPKHTTKTPEKQTQKKQTPTNTRKKPRDGTNFGYYKKNNIHDMQLHWTVLRQLLSESKTHKHCRLVKCMTDAGNWHGAKWICQQKKGLFLLFGYVDNTPASGHFVAMNADQNCLVDSLKPDKLLDISAASLQEVFACSNKHTASDPQFGAFDCAFQLYFF